MLEPTYLLLCSKVVVHPQTHAVSLVDLIDMAVIPIPLPADQVVLAPFEFFIVSGWRRDDETRPMAFPIRFNLIGPAGNRHDLGEQQVRLDPNHLGVAAVRVLQLPLTGPGQYRVEVEWLDPNEKVWKRGPWAGLWLPAPGEWRPNR